MHVKGEPGRLALLHACSDEGWCREGEGVAALEVRRGEAQAQKRRLFGLLQ